MGQPELSVEIADEAALGALAAKVAAQWLERGSEQFLSVGLRGDLGAGKTAWVRALLRALGHDGRVPSPTYTLMEIYEVGAISLIHMDLYRIDGDDELAQLGLRDWLGRPGCWILAEWPERAPLWFSSCDIELRIEIAGATARRIHARARDAAASAWLTPFELT
jgi:tRNA threonylcarbamoyladenosine biosynthesis protein TsaE